MTDDELRAIVREAVARHMAGGVAAARATGTRTAARGPTPVLGPFSDPASRVLGTGLLQQPAAAPAGATVVIANAPGGIAIAAGPGATVQVHISHAAFSLPPACEGGHDGPCAIEPDAACNQCGFCQSYGH